MSRNMASESSSTATDVKSSSKIGPAAQLLLELNGLSLNDVSPSGPQGIITKGSPRTHFFGFTMATTPVAAGAILTPAVRICQLRQKPSVQLRAVIERMAFGHIGDVLEALGQASNSSKKQQQQQKQQASVVEKPQSKEKPPDTQQQPISVEPNKDQKTQRTQEKPARQSVESPDVKIRVLLAKKLLEEGQQIPSHWLKDWAR